MYPGLDTPKLSLNGLNTKARLVDIVDGDTVYLVIPFENKFYKWNTRLSGLDTCEKNSKVNANKELGYAATHFVTQFFTGKTNLTRKEIQKELNDNVVIVDVCCGAFDKYGRLLATIFYNDLSLSKELLDHKLAYEYHGGTKR